MYTNQHLFHIPVMGTGHSIDSPIRLAHLGINSVISVVDDLLLEKIRKYYCGLHDLPYQNIPRTAPDGRAKRVTAYLELVNQIVQKQFVALCNLPMFQNSEKDQYFRLLPDHHPLKKSYLNLQSQAAKQLLSQDELTNQANILTGQMKPGAIEVNIMAKVDALKMDQDDQPMSSEFSDANSALRGVANSDLPCSLVLSAGFNPRLYSYISNFRDFYRDDSGRKKKNIVLKVSDYRSALIQGKFLAKKGLEINEFRIESGLNCGGHVFPSDGVLLPVLLQEFSQKREELANTFQPLINDYYQSRGWTLTLPRGESSAPAVTVQGGIGTSGERQRLLDEYGMDSTGWGSPFLLVPEATCVDDETSRLLADAGEESFYLSGVSPLGVPFNNIRGSGSETYKLEQIRKGKPGSKCPKGFLVSNTEFTKNPICTASSQYQLLKIDQIEQSGQTESEKAEQIDTVLEKSCLCQHLGSGALIRLGMQKPSYGRQSICPGPNLAWFNQSYTLEEMVDHIYGRRPSLVPAGRPHMFAKELAMYVDYIEELAARADGNESVNRTIDTFRKNLEKGMEECLRIANSTPYGSENLLSLEKAVEDARKRLEQFEIIA